MKKLIILFLLFSISQSVKAQLSIRVGGISSKFILEDHAPLPGINVGVIKAFGGDGFQIITGLLFSQKGTKVEFNNNVTKVRVNYIDVPVNLSYGINIGRSSRIFVEFGPYLGVALNGSVNSNGDQTNIEIGEDIKVIDVGVNAGINLRVSKFQIGIGLNNGLAGVLPNSISEATNYRYASLNLSYIIL